MGTETPPFLVARRSSGPPSPIVARIDRECDALTTAGRSEWTPPFTVLKKNRAE